MDASVAGGLFALGGVLTGGAINYVATTRQGLRERRRAVRVSVRLVAEELERNGQVMEGTLHAETWGPIGKAPLDREAWAEHKAVLADLPYEMWHELRAAQRLVAMIDRVHRLGDFARPLRPIDSDHISEAREEARRVALLLDERYARSWWERRRTTPAGPPR